MNFSCSKVSHKPAHSTAYDDGKWETLQSMCVVSQLWKKAKLSLILYTCGKQLCGFIPIDWSCSSSLCESSFLSFLIQQSLFPQTTRWCWVLNLWNKSIQQQRCLLLFNPALCMPIQFVRAMQIFYQQLFWNTPYTILLHVSSTSIRFPFLKWLFLSRRLHRACIVSNEKDAPLFPWQDER